jgi:hypothetical protein
MIIYSNKEENALEGVRVRVTRNIINKDAFWPMIMRDIPV